MIKNVGINDLKRLVSEFENQEDIDDIDDIFKALNKLISRYTPVHEKHEESLAELADRKGCFLEIETSYTIHGRKDGIDVEFGKENARAFLNSLPDVEVKP